MKNRFCALLFIVFFFVGCNKQSQQPDAMSDASAVPTLGVPMPSAEILAALGPENNLPIHRLLPDPIFAVTGKPKQFLASPICTGGEMLIATEIAQRLQLYFNPHTVEFFVISSGLPFPAQVIVPHSQDPNAPPQQRTIPIARWATVMTFDAPVELSALISALRGAEVDAGLMESLKRTEGNNEYYDLTPQDIISIFPQRAALGMHDERTIVLVEGLETDIKAVFSDTTPKNAVLERLKRSPVDANDWTIVTSLEGLSERPAVFDALLAQIEQAGNIPSNVMPAVKQHLRALTLSVNVSATVGEPIVSIYAEGLDEKSAEIIRDTVQGTIVHSQTSLATMSEEERQKLSRSPDFSAALLHAMSLKLEGERVYFSLNNFESLIPTIAEEFRTQQITLQNAIQQEQLQRWRSEQLRGFAVLFSRYYAQHQKFPADIVDADGKPLLSWRVALLPAMGMEDLYNKFKKDEPWDSEANLALLRSSEPEPNLRVFHAMTPDVAPPKTVVRFFDSAGTPFSKKDLKIEDIKSPEQTLMFVIVTPQYAVEWTKPEPLEFDGDKLADIFGVQLWGVSFTGQICALPVLPPADPEYGEWKRYVESLIKVLPQETE